MRRPLLLPTVLLLLWVIRHNAKKNTGNDGQSVKNFLENEDKANATRRKDISNLPYIPVPLDTLPLNITLKDEKKQLQILEYIKELRNLSEKKILNLTGISNTELKAAYGPANLELLSLYDQTYTRYVRTLHLFASCIYEEYPDEAVRVLEYCLSIGTDISGTFCLLGQHYLKNDDKAHFDSLYDNIPNKESLSGKTIVKKLDRLRTEATADYQSLS